MKPSAALCRLALGACIAIGTAGCAIHGGQSSVGQAIDDTTISTRVKARFAEDPGVSAMRIGVTTLDGTVQLSGFAVSQAEKDKAGRIAGGVPDVKAVRNDIIVRAPGS